MKNSKTTIALAWVVVALLFATCKKDIAPEPCTDPLNPDCINYHPCNGVQPVTADFEMAYYDRFDNKIIEIDSVFPPGTILFKAKLNNAAYQWQLGKETLTVQQDYRIFSNNGSRDSSIYGTYYNTLTVRKRPNLSCYPDNDSLAIITRSITIKRPSQLLTTGMFKVLVDGYADSNIIQILSRTPSYINPVNNEVIDNRLFIGFKDMIKDTMLTNGGSDSFYYLDKTIYLGRKGLLTAPYKGIIKVDPLTLNIEGNYNITVINPNGDIEKFHQFKGRKL